LRKQIVKRRLVASAEVGKRVMVDRLQPAQPRQAGFVFALASDLARAADALAVGIQPQRDQQLRINCWAAGAPFHRSGGLVIQRQIERPDEIPKGAGRMLLIDQPLDVDRPEQQLTAINQNEAWGGRIGCRHALSIRRRLQF
jgi:hypothetical protein